ncbi:uncharacterized protein BO66DRAFT_414490 [Aspergillus aculeatinus CBS 121060]|uniref:Uncharacterized protein n=1 Tax=Aspergillus aculeatinus CBS 121060 TaxID=1448322 RepID=A0ACD1GYD7_9EURO|nr:hypothetical protein BO66DRAFT_414490 [Aspergillus aculeatinus CBS 121060]RAH66233.1 hypothetical protein BO66DRAFT_414490 [Aspergillus aculeatinus CBS 121060]
MAAVIAPSFPNPHESSFLHPRHSMNLLDTEVEMGNLNPYQQFLSSSPAPARTLNRQRSTSFPSVHYSGSPEHQPVDQRRRKASPSRRHRSQRHARTQSHQPRFSRNSQLVNPDVIDRLDDAGVYQYHHEGPYDAVYPERNVIDKLSPVAALRESNAEALKATPHDKIVDCLDSHRPLDGVAHYPPGHTDPQGHTYEYEEGNNMMNDYGNFMRCPGMKFKDEDFKNDPFYNTPHPNPFASLRKRFSLRRRNRRGTN